MQYIGAGIQDSDLDDDSDVPEMDEDLYDLYEIYFEAEGSDSDEAGRANDQDTAHDSQSNYSESKD